MTVAELEVVIGEMQRQITALQASSQVRGRCNTEFPHIGELSYSAGRYLCRCGMRYSKDGKGSLRVEN